MAVDPSHPRSGAEGSGDALPRLGLALGAQVRLQGLKGAKELNGRRGKVVAIDAESGRYNVELDGESGENQKSVRPECLVRLVSYCPLCDHEENLERAGEKCPRCGAAELVKPYPEGSARPEGEENKKTDREHRFLNIAMNFQSVSWNTDLFQWLRVYPELINAQPAKPNGSKRWSALHQAVLNGDPEIIKRLVVNFNANCYAEVLDEGHVLTPSDVVLRIYEDQTFVNRHAVRRENFENQQGTPIPGRKKQLLELVKPPDASTVVAHTFMVINESGEIILGHSSRSVLQRAWLHQPGCDRVNITRQINSKYSERWDEFCQSWDGMPCGLGPLLGPLLRPCFAALPVFEVHQEDVSDLFMETYQEASDGHWTDHLASAAGMFMPFTDITRALKIRFQAHRGENLWAVLQSVGREGQWHFYLTIWLIFVTTQVFNVIKSIGSLTFMITFVWSLFKGDFSNIGTHILYAAVILGVLLLGGPIKALNRALKPRVPFLWVRKCRLRAPQQAEAGAVAVAAAPAAPPQGAAAPPALQTPLLAEP